MGVTKLYDTGKVTQVLMRNQVDGKPVKQLAKIFKVTRQTSIGEFDFEIMISIVGVQDGVVTVMPFNNVDLEHFARVIAACFNPNSNFKEEVFKAFELDENDEFKAIQCCFTNPFCIATKEQHDPMWIVSQWDNS